MTTLLPLTVNLPTRHTPVDVQLTSPQFTITLCTAHMARSVIHRLVPCFRRSGPVNGKACHGPGLQASTSIEAYLANVKQCDRLICDFVSTFYTQVSHNIDTSSVTVAPYLVRSRASACTRCLHPDYVLPNVGSAPGHAMV